MKEYTVSEKTLSNIMVKIYYLIRYDDFLFGIMLNRNNVRLRQTYRAVLKKNDKQ